MQIQDITFQQLMQGIAIILVLIGGYNICMTAWKNRQEMLKEKNSPIRKLDERVTQHDEFLAADKRRIEALEKGQHILKKHNKIQDDGMRVLMLNAIAQSRHMQHGNNLEGLRKAENEMNEYLTERGTDNE